VIIGVLTVAGMISDLRKGVNPWAGAVELGTGIRTPNVIFGMPVEMRR
jgi:hypothetical protein